jgi:hypothetical protein
MIKPFEFAEEGRSYCCTLEERRGTKGEYWWWFTVSGDPQSYAPFQAASSDTRTSVQERVVKFYHNRLWVLSQPSQRGGHWGRRGVAMGPAQAPSPKDPS